MRASECEREMSQTQLMIISSFNPVKRDQKWANHMTDSYSCAHPCVSHRKCEGSNKNSLKVMSSRLAYKMFNTNIDSLVLCATSAKMQCLMGSREVKGHDRLHV